MIDAGALTEADAKNHPQKNVITQALGASYLPEVEVDSVSGTLFQGEKILLCSDGLTGELDDREIADILAMPGTEQEAVDHLIEAANAHGGEDNITVILVSAPADAPPPRARKSGTVPMKAITLDGQPKTDKKRPIYLYLVILAVVFVILLLAVIL
jgi:protein phosphatase